MSRHHHELRSPESGDARAPAVSTEYGPPSSFRPSSRPRSFAPPPSQTSKMPATGTSGSFDQRRHFPVTPATSDVPASPASAASAASAGPSEVPAEARPESRRLAPLERWAVRATPSQFNALAGAIGGFTSGVVVCPLDVIKTKLQAQGGFAAVPQGPHGSHHKMYDGLVGTAKVIWREEGIRGMYRGLGPIILGYLPTWAVWFTVYNKSKVWMGQYNQNTFFINFWSSIVAGASSTVVTNPIWVIKTRLMSQSAHHGAKTGFLIHPRGTNTPTSRPTLQSPWHYRSTLDAARKMYTTEGILSFYSGLTPALLGLSHVAVQFPAYEFLKTKFTGQGMGAAPIDGDHGQASHQWFGVLSASILSKILASSATYPHEVIRTRLQTQRRHVASAHPSSSLPASAKTMTTDVTGGGVKPNTTSITPQSPKYKGVVMTCRTILREEGWRAFYAGMGANMMRAVPAATVTMMTYEYVMRTLNQAKANGLKFRDDLGESPWSAP